MQTVTIFTAGNMIIKRQRQKRVFTLGIEMVQVKMQDGFLVLAF